MKVILQVIFIFIFSYGVWASPPPCSKWEVSVKAHEVQAYKRTDGTAVREAARNTHCRLKFPRVNGWQERFTDKMPLGWPETSERFRPWSQLEKEIVLKWLSEQPQALRDLKEITFLRGYLSAKHPNNPGSTVKRINAVALYDEFFKANNKSAILSHELSHLYLYNLGLNPRMDDLIASTGWSTDRNNKYVRNPSIPLLLPDSAFNIQEDLANHFEFYLHHPEVLKHKNPKAFNKLFDVVGPNFKLEN